MWVCLFQGCRTVTGGAIKAATTVMILLIPRMSPARCSGERKQGTHLSVPAFPLHWNPIKGHWLQTVIPKAPVSIIQIFLLSLLLSWRHCSRSSHI